MTSPLAQAVAQRLLLPTFVIAAAMLVKGYATVGDGFSAGVIVTLGIWLQYAAGRARAMEARLPARWGPRLAIGGLALTTAVVFAPLAWGGAPLTHAPGPGDKVEHLGTLELHSALLFDVGVFAVVVGFGLTALHYLAHRSEEAA